MKIRGLLYERERERERERQRETKRDRETERQRGIEIEREAERIGMIAFLNVCWHSPVNPSGPRTVCFGMVLIAESFF